MTAKLSHDGLHADVTMALGIATALVLIEQCGDAFEPTDEEIAVTRGMLTHQLQDRLRALLEFLTPRTTLVD